ncbi:hypothetical protein [Homoserinimonas sp. OAct 916]|uniref:hypothetical protein n=1 Tax=Homoserinimonas sp. OAct 916 TaxID=2211450 RepID=UPI001300BEB4|nr:hypothetical protein [Homoserinimonas sp. OAct 916]
MKFIIPVTAVVAITLTLVGCAGEVQTESDEIKPANSITETSPTASPIPTPTRDPGPVKLTDTDASERFLNLVCPNNIAIAELIASFDSGESELFDGGDPDPTPVKVAAQKRVDLNRATIALLDDEYFVWPVAVRDHIGHIRNSYMAELSTLNAIANTATFRDAYYATWVEATPEQAAAGQEIRYQLGLDANTTTSCDGYETGVDDLTQEQASREAELGE